MADLTNIQSRMKNMEQSDNRKMIRFALDSIIRDSNVTDVDGLVKNLKKLGVTLTTKDSDGNPLDEWTLANTKNSDFPPVKLSQLSKKYNYTNDNVKKALASNKLDPID